MKTHFHMKGHAPRLTLKKRYKTTRKWPIQPKTPNSVLRSFRKKIWQPQGEKRKPNLQTVKIRAVVHFYKQDETVSLYKLNDTSTYCNKKFSLRSRRKRAREASMREKNGFWELGPGPPFFFRVLAPLSPPHLRLLGRLQEILKNLQAAHILSPPSPFPEEKCVFFKETLAVLGFW